jgi:hypothetical protein
MAIITVTTTADSGSGSLREAISNAQSGDTIKFSSNLANQKITLTGGQLTVKQNITLDGSGASNLTINGNSSTRILAVEKFLNVNIKNLNFTNGRTTGAGGAGEGGAIQVRDYSTLTVENSKFTNNSASRGGAIRVGYGGGLTVRGSTFDSNDGTLSNDGFSAGAIATYGAGGAAGKGKLVIENSTFTNNKGVNGGAVYNLLGPLTIKNSVFKNNASTREGGAIFTDGADGDERDTVGGKILIESSQFEGNKAKAGGGALYLWTYRGDEAIIKDSTVLGNSVAKGGSNNLGRGGGIEFAGSKLTIANTTIANNTSPVQGGGLWVNNNTSAVTITSSTISGNKALEDAGGGLFINTWDGRPVKIINSTIADNFAGRDAGGIWTGGSNSDDVTLTNTLFSGNVAEKTKQGHSNFILREGGGNIVETIVGGRGPKVTSNSRYVDDANLSGLQKVGNDLVHQLLPNSPAINAGITNGAPTTDQTGMSRNGKPDVGAYEVRSQTPTPLPKEDTPPAAPEPVTPEPPAVPEPIIAEPPAAPKPVTPESPVGNDKPVTLPDSGSPTPPDAGTPEPLVAEADVITTKANTAVKIDVLANDQIAGDFTLAIGDRPTNGTVTLDNNGTLNDLTDDFIRYTPKTDVAGEDSFTYRLSRNGESVSTTVKVTVTEEPSSESPLLSNPLPSNPLPSNPLPSNPTPEVPTPEVSTPEVPTSVQPKPNLFTQTKLIDLRNVDLDNNSEVNSQVAAEFGEISSNAAYNNSVGLYVVADESGAVVDPDSDQLIRPGETGYAEAALKQRLAGVELNRATGELSAALETGVLLAPYIVSNGSADQFLSQNPSNLQNSDSLNAFFAFGVANPDRKTHIKLLNDNTFVFEDKLGGGDQDFNDFAFKLNVQGAA